MRKYVRDEDKPIFDIVFLTFLLGFSARRVLMTLLLCKFLFLFGGLDRLTNQPRNPATRGGWGFTYNGLSYNGLSYNNLAIFKQDSAITKKDGAITERAITGRNQL